MLYVLAVFSESWWSSLIIVLLNSGASFIVWVCKGIYAAWVQKVTIKVHDCVSVYPIHILDYPGTLHLEFINIIYIYYRDSPYHHPVVYNFKMGIKWFTPSRVWSTLILLVVCVYPTSPPPLSGARGLSVSLLLALTVVLTLNCPTGDEGMYTRERLPVCCVSF